jgi:hypothetical protein
MMSVGSSRDTEGIQEVSQPVTRRKLACRLDVSLAADGWTEPLPCWRPSYARNYSYVGWQSTRRSRRHSKTSSVQLSANGPPTLSADECHTFDGGRHENAT